MFPPIMLLVCLTLANFGGPREQVVLFAGSTYLCFSDPVSTCSVWILHVCCTFMSKSLCNILVVCVLHGLGMNCIRLSFHCDLCVTISSSAQKKREIILLWQTDSLTTVSALIPMEKSSPEVCLFWAKRKSFFMGLLKTTRFLGRN